MNEYEVHYFNEENKIVIQNVVCQGIGFAFDNAYFYIFEENEEQGTFTRQDVLNVANDKLIMIK